MKLAVKRRSEQLQPANFRFYSRPALLLGGSSLASQHFLIQLANSNQWLTSGYFHFQPISPAARHFRIYFSTESFSFSLNSSSSSSSFTCRFD
jgi:hypothetical protein